MQQQGAPQYLFRSQNGLQRQSSMPLPNVMGSFELSGSFNCYQTQNGVPPQQLNQIQKQMQHIQMQASGARHATPSPMLRPQNINQSQQNSPNLSSIPTMVSSEIPSTPSLTARKAQAQQQHIWPSKAQQPQTPASTPMKTTTTVHSTPSMPSEIAVADSDGSLRKRSRAWAKRAGVPSSRYAELDQLVSLAEATFISKDRVKNLKAIDEGSFGQIYSATLDMSPVAVKGFSTQNGSAVLLTKMREILLEVHDLNLVVFCH